MPIGDATSDLIPWIPLMSTIVTAIIAPVVIAIVQARFEHKKGVAPNIPQGSLGPATPPAADVVGSLQRASAKRNVFWLLLRRLIVGSILMALCLYCVVYLFEADVAEEFGVPLIILLIVLLVTIAVITVINIFRIVLFGLRYLYVISDH